MLFSFYLGFFPPLFFFAYKGHLFYKTVYLKDGNFKGIWGPVTPISPDGPNSGDDLRKNLIYCSSSQLAPMDCKKKKKSSSDNDPTVGLVTWSWQSLLLNPLKLKCSYEIFETDRSAVFCSKNVKFFLKPVMWHIPWRNLLVIQIRGVNFLLIPNT